MYVIYMYIDSKVLSLLFQVSVSFTGYIFAFGLDVEVPFYIYICTLYKHNGDQTFTFLQTDTSALHQHFFKPPLHKVD